MALQNAERTEDEKDRAEIIFKIARSRKGIKRWTSSYIDQGVCEKRSDQLNRRVKRITSKMMVVRKAHPTNPERIKVLYLSLKSGIYAPGIHVPVSINTGTHFDLMNRNGLGSTGSGSQIPDLITPRIRVTRTK